MALKSCIGALAAFTTLASLTEQRYKFKEKISLIPGKLIFRFFGHVVSHFNSIVHINVGRRRGYGQFFSEWESM